MKVARQKHARKLAVLIGLAMLNTFCATVDKGKSRTTLSMDSEYAHAGDKVYGCDGALISEQRHHQVGGKAALRYEHRKGGIAQVDGGAIYGQNNRSMTRSIHPLREDYVMGTAGLLLGWDFQHVGLDGGVSLVWGDCTEEVLAFPRLNLRLGNMEEAWFETGLGPMDAPFDGRIVFAGVGMRSEWINLNVGLAAMGRPMVDLEDNGLIIGHMANVGPDPGLYTRLSIHLGDYLSLNLGGVLAEAFSFQAGLSFHL